MPDFVDGGEPMLALPSLFPLLNEFLPFFSTVQPWTITSD